MSAAPEEKTSDDKPFRRPPSPRFRVHAELDNRGVRVPCTVRLIRPVSGGGEVVLRVRRRHSRKFYDVLLSDVARWAYRREARAELEAKQRARKSRRAH